MTQLFCHKFSFFNGTSLSYLKKSSFPLVYAIDYMRSYQKWMWQINKAKKDKECDTTIEYLYFNEFEAKYGVFLHNSCVIYN